MSMDIIKGKLDGISKPASSSRSRPGSRSSTASLEVLSPEPGPFKIDMVSKLNSDKEGQSSNSSVEERRNSSDDKWADHSKNTQSAKESSDEDLDFTQDQMTPEHPDDPEGPDTELRNAIRKMRRLDEILAKRQSREKEVKKQGVEMRLKLWEELKSAKHTEDLENDEELENTNKFLCLTSESAGTAAVEPLHCEFEDALFSVFDTQIPPETYENHVQIIEKAFTCDVEKNEPLVETERKPFPNTERIELKSKHSQDFIKRNIELAKSSRSPVVMIDTEKKRLDELLEGLDDTDSGLSSSEEPLPDEEKNTEATPGEKVLRDNKEQRDRQCRLRAIDGKLRAISEQQLNSTSRLSEEQLKCLLDECVAQEKCIPLGLSSKRENGGTGSAHDGPPQLCPSPLCELLDESEATVQKTQPDDVNRLAHEEHASSAGSYLTKALAGHYNPEALIMEVETMKHVQFSKEEPFNDAADYFMSKTVGIGRLKKPPFLDDPLDDINTSSSSDDQKLKLSLADQPVVDEQQPGDAVDEPEEREA